MIDGLDGYVCANEVEDVPRGHLCGSLLLIHLNILNSSTPPSIGSACVTG